MWKLKKIIKRKGFTLAELVTAVAILAILAGFVSVIFRSSIDGYRSAGANTEIMQKLRAITEQLNTDFEGLCKDGYLIIRIDMHAERPVYENNPQTKDVYMDRIYYFTTGDFQSWDQYEYEIGKFKYLKSNIARIFWGHSSESLDDNLDLPLSNCRFARDVLLLTPNPDPNIVLPDDCNSLSFAQCKYSLSILEVFDELLDESIALNDPNNLRSFMCENIGEFKIEWSDGIFDTVTGDLIWLPPRGTTSHQKICGPNGVKPKALKFTFTLYDSKGILLGGRRFSHIVYLDN